MSKGFEKAFAKLNDEQKKAVLGIDGPMLVVAGPGTGKTQLLSTRVANILKTTDTRPNNILCLTYTNKAAVNMKERIIELAGAEGAKVQASTFHSFAAEIMNLYPEHFWSAARLSVAPDVLQLEIVESIVRELPLDNPLALKFAGDFTLLNNIQEGIKLAKEAGLTPEKLTAIIDFNLRYIDEIEEELSEILAPALSFKKLGQLREKVQALPDHKIDKLMTPLLSLSTVINESLDQAIEADQAIGKCTQTGRWKKRWLQTVNGQRGIHKERQRNQWWLELADVYDKYRDRLHKRAYYDYADMLVEVIAQLEQSPEMLADIQERFSYVLLDEFQDSTPAQMRLAHLVAEHHSSEGKPNLMAVGDDDQSIYKFNGAQLNNMLSFRRTYPDAKTIVLTKNYRSTQNILDSANKIIEQAENRLVNADKRLKKDLIAFDPPKQKGQTSAMSYASAELQMSAIARAIKRNYSPKTTTAVLARGHDSLIKMASILQQLGVPVRYEQASNILEQEVVSQVHYICKLLLAINEGDRDNASAMVHHIVRWPAWGIEPKVLWRLAAENYPAKNWLDSLLVNKNPKLRKIGEWFLDLAGQAAVQPVAVTIEQIIGLRPSQKFTSPVRNYFFGSAGGDINKYLHGLSAVQLLRGMVHEFAAGKQPSLAELVRFLQVNIDNKQIISDESPFITGRHAVQLFTVHKAKGLEFDSVYIIDAVQDNWQPRVRGRKPPANLPLRPALDDMDDYIRLMYVAATRAKSSLTISGYYQDHSGKDVALSPIVQSAFDVNKLETAANKEVINVLEENLRWPQLFGGAEKEILRARLEAYNLNLTHLLNFLNIERGGPQYFKERNLLRLPEAKTPYLAYGTAMHAALDSAQKLTNQRKYSLTKVITVFTAALKDEQLPVLDFERYLAKGVSSLSKLFNEFKYSLPKGSLSEQKLSQVQLGTAQVSGKLDRVDEAGGVMRIIDYKTGKPLASFFTKDKTKAQKAYNHRMQLIFYALLLEARDLRLGARVEGQMVYVEAGREKELVRSYEPTKQDRERLQKLIEAVYKKVKSYDLPDVSRYSADFAGSLAFEDDLINGKI